jgi:TrmH family RNA methyltransferase
MSPKKIKKLTLKKHRSETGLFIVEGDKNIRELLRSDFNVLHITGTKDFLSVLFDAIAQYEQRTNTRVSVQPIAEDELVKLGTLLSNNAGIAVAEQKPEPSIDSVLEEATRNIVVVLDDIRDPGNMGTILRTADWYGVAHIVASPTTAERYNPKVISSSMGSFTRMQVSHSSLEVVLRAANEKCIPVIVADLEGESSHTASLPTHGFLLMGSESHGVSEEAKKHASHRVMIPRFGQAESLNVSIATAILLDALRRGR